RSRRTMRRPTRKQKTSMPVRAKTHARARAVARAVTMAARARTHARARAAAVPMVSRWTKSRPEDCHSLKLNACRGGRQDLRVPSQLQDSSGDFNAGKSLQRVYRLRDRYWPAVPPLRPHSDKEAGMRLV